MNNANPSTNHNPRIRPRSITGTSTSTSTSTSTNRNTDVSFSEYVLFPLNTPATSTSTTPIQNPFIFQSGIPTQHLVPAPVSSNFQFSFPLTPQTEPSPIEEVQINIDQRNTAFDLTIQESESHKKKKIYQKLAKFIEEYLEDKLDDTYCLTRYTLFEIDGVQADVYIGKESESYYYHFVAKNVEYVEEDDSTNDDTDFLLIEKNDFDTVMDVLEHIEKVRDTYTFLDFYLLSPEFKEIAKIHRTFLPLSQDKICSVCYEPTLEYTTCKHPICLKCREKCIVNDRKMCPVCRSSLLKLYPPELAKL